MGGDGVVEVCIVFWVENVGWVLNGDSWSVVSDLETNSNVSGCCEDVDECCYVNDVCGD